MVNAGRASLQTFRSVGAMMMREMVTTYGRTPGGFIWAFVEPVAAIALLSIVFSLAFHAPSLGTSFVLFYASGYLPFILFNDVVNKTATSLRFSRPLLAYPVVSYLDAILARFVLNILTHFVVFVVVISGVFLIIRPPTLVDPLKVLLALAMAAALAFGVGVINCLLTSAFHVWERLWQIVTRPLFIVSGILFIFEDVPANFRDMLWLNPLFHVTGAMRDGIYSNYEPTYVSPGFVFGTALVLGVFGLVFLNRNHRIILEK